MISRSLAASALAVTVLTTAAVSACSSSTDGSSTGTQGGLAGALKSIALPATGAPDEIQYGDIARQRELGIVNPAGLTDRTTKPIALAWSTVAGYGTGRLTNAYVALTDTVGINVFRADSAVTAGSPPNSVIRISGGIDAGTVTAKLTKLGAKPRTYGSVKGLSLGGDNAIDRSSPLGAMGLLNELNQTVVDGDTLSASPNATALARSVGGGKSVLDDAGYRAVVDCLGDVIAAEIVVPDKPGNSAIVAVGERDPGSLSAAGREVVCLLPADGKADAVKAAVAKNLALTGSDPATHAPLSTYAQESTIGSSGDAVRAELTMAKDKPTGFAFRALLMGTWRFWDGTCTTGAVLARTC